MRRYYTPWSIALLVVFVRQWLYGLVPARLMSCSVMMKTRHHLSVKALALTVGMGTICSTCQVSHTQIDIDCCKDHGYKLQSVVCQIIDMTHAQDGPTFHKSGQCARWGYCGDWCSPYQFHISVFRKYYVLIVLLCLKQWSQNIHCIKYEQASDRKHT